MSRRKSPADAIPAGVSQWFAGTATGDAAGWWPLLHTDEAKLMAWWRQWRETHPQATPPGDAPWLPWGAA